MTRLTVTRLSLESLRPVSVLVTVGLVVGVTLDTRVSVFQKGLGSGGVYLVK